MNILHIAPLSPYNVGWSYQDNLLPKYQRKLGHQVSVIVSPFQNTANGKEYVGEEDFELPDGVHVYRRERLFGNNFFAKALSYTYVADIIEQVKPDLIMIHSLMTLAVFEAIHYKKAVNPKCIIIQDNHLDENIGKRKTKMLTDIYYRYWALINSFAEPYVAKYYGVTPWRVDFIINRFRIKKEKTDLLIMGADMENIDFSNRKHFRDELNLRYQLEKTFLIITGGKIEKNKKIAELMQAVQGLENVKLLIFGKVSEDYVEEIEHSKNENTIMLGWLNLHEINSYLLAADMAIFPGQHSVLWEQACACKTPCLFAYWEGMEHLNNGGNSSTIQTITPAGLRNGIKKYQFTEEYDKMLRIARSDATDVYSYYSIAQKSLEMIEGNCTT